MSLPGKPTVFPNGIRAPLMNSSNAQPSAIADLTDSTGGTASSTLAAITAGATYAQADITAIKNGLASLAAQIAAINAALKAAQVTKAS